MRDSPKPTANFSQLRVTNWRANVPISQRDFALVRIKPPGLVCRQEHVGSVRSNVLGRGRIPKEQIKTVILAWCFRRGWRPPDHNAADALVLWYYTTTIGRRAAA
jgi:hypothetical protein